MFAFKVFNIYVENEYFFSLCDENCNIFIILMVCILKDSNIGSHNHWENSEITFMRTSLAFSNERFQRQALIIAILHGILSRYKASKRAACLKA